MTGKEIIQALHICGEDEPCETCPVQLDEDERVCVGALFKHAAAAIERLTAENAALREAYLQKDKIQALFKAKLDEFEAERDAAIADLADIRSCRVCKHVCDTRDCSSCQDETCKCRNCSLDKHAWEWRGVSWMPVLPNEGGLSWAPRSLGAEGEQSANKPLTVQELVELNGQPVWMGEPFNKWTRVEIDPKNIPDITPEMKIRKGIMNVNGESVEIPPVNFYREPPRKIAAGDENAELRKKVPQWISVEDRLPSPGARVLITDGVFVGEGFLAGKAFFGRGEGTSWKRYSNIPWDKSMKTEITNWMPLPDAPKFADILRGAPDAPEG